MGSTFDCFVWSKIEIIFSGLIAALVTLLSDHLFVLQPCLLLVSQRSSQRVPMVSSTSTGSVIRNFTSMPKIQGIITVFPFLFYYSHISPKMISLVVVQPRPLHSHRLESPQWISEFCWTARRRFIHITWRTNKIFFMVYRTYENCRFVKFKARKYK